ncbi:hypothetical protein SAMN05428975_3812 [Mucilaginibacter sp. OK268]|uniref:hypothetical protein n=1 Tax=Mucilaginibacter sp. OK268 TaxID=1881048 RepID=UPI00088E3B1E|nr:hypothetical protein [Mucilaginibacter sp. OK268]SDP93872.1 hypothetical protein SAMN05428975_3812 [Mucilaginibacter sp. OK268]
MIKSIPENFHDGIIQDICISFHKKITALTLENYLLKNDRPNGLTIKRKLSFYGVVLQEFSSFQQDNIVFDITESESFDDFLVEQKLYLERMRNYFNPGFLESIRIDQDLKYYSIHTSTGVEGFVISRGYEIVSL